MGSISNDQKRRQEDEKRISKWRKGEPSFVRVFEKTISL